MAQAAAAAQQAAAAAQPPPTVVPLSAVAPSVLLSGARGSGSVTAPQPPALLSNAPSGPSAGFLPTSSLPSATAAAARQQLTSSGGGAESAQQQQQRAWASGGASQLLYGGGAEEGASIRRREMGSGAGAAPDGSVRSLYSRQVGVAAIAGVVMALGFGLGFGLICCVAGTVSRLSLAPPAPLAGL